MKVLALYLPQYHEVKENNEWWGKGFTDWVTVRNGRAQFKDHMQPISPMDEYYYDLLDPATMRWQANLLTKYGIDGLCIYHYWFKNGRKILEKPAENLLKWKDINLHFCFSWANETWARTWSQIEGRNTWASIYEKKGDGSRGVLLEQTYGQTEDWIAHFNYFLPFFLDERYIKVGNRPVLMLHKLKDIYCFENMLEVWNDLAHKNGLGDIYVIGNQPRESQMKFVDLRFVCEPGSAMLQTRSENRDGVKCYDYDEIWQNIIAEDTSVASVGGFVNYDDTPRHGKRGSVILNGSPEKFRKYMEVLIDKNKKSGNEFLFVNAWNEWGEGMYLEPDSKNQYEYLEAVHDSIENGQIIPSEQYHSKERYVPEVDYYRMKECFEKEKLIRSLLEKWIWITKKPGKMLEYISGMGKIVVYGYGVLGKQFVYELKSFECSLVGVIDRRNIGNCPVEVLSPDSDLHGVDSIVVTAVYDYGEVFDNLRSRNRHIRIVSLETIINEFYEAI